jgi:hypothetical protein
VDVGRGVTVRRYKPLPRTCDACHVDVHKGAFQGMEKLVRAAAGQGTSCDRCHTVDGWREVGFAHQRTGFPLRGAHARTSCKSCHPISFTRALGRDCSSCHRDVHAGRLGARCAGCHDESGWATKFDADAHRRGNFPLVGKHAFIPCQECHGERRDRGFTRSTAACISCHQRDYDRTATSAVDHRAAGFSTNCQQCHDPWRFRGASFGQHEACFRIASGPHAGISCLKCHTSLSGFALTGACSTGTASCTRCHSCGGHPSVAGFACADRKCYECHRFSNPGSSALRALRRSP